MADGESQISKLTFSEPMNFKFSAAYEAYSKLYDEVSDEAKPELNNLISNLFEEEISYQAFYGSLNQFREEGENYQFARTRIRGQRKRAYRRDQVERDRIKRHKR